MFETLASFTAALAQLPVADQRKRELATARQQILLKPPGSLGRLEEVAVFLAGWAREELPCAKVMRLVIFAGNHGVVRHGVSPYPSEVTAQMVANFRAGGAASSAFTAALGLGFDVVDIELDRPTGDISSGAAMSEGELLRALNVGASSLEPDDDVLVLGEMGIGNTTIAATLAARSFGGDGASWVGPGTGLDKAGVSRKAKVVDRALSVHSNSPHSAVETLRLVGGRETAAIAGAIVAARQEKVPVILDGYVVCAALAPLFAEAPKIVEHCIAGHVSAEPAHGNLLRALGVEPLLDLRMRLGEGTGAVLASSLLRAACAAHNNMATFEEAQVAGREDD